MAGTLYPVLPAYRKPEHPALKTVIVAAMDSHLACESGEEGPQGTEKGPGCFTHPDP